eukprot:15430524-Alexandrium_andersonii.AAC.1
MLGLRHIGNGPFCTGRPPKRTAGQCRQRSGLKSCCLGTLHYTVPETQSAIRPRLVGDAICLCPPSVRPRVGQRL